MYDSRSSHPRGTWTRMGKSKNGSSHPHRAWVRYNGDKLRGVITRPTLTHREAIAEGLAEVQEVREADCSGDGLDDMPGLKRLNVGPRWAPLTCRHGFEDWEARVLCGCSLSSEFTPAFEVRPVRDDTPEDSDERMAEWEVVLLEGAEGACWTTKTEPVPVGEYVEADPEWDAWEDDYLPESADAPDTHWLDGDPRDFFQAVGDGWLIEGPSLPEPSVKAGGYVRVYDLAREVGIDAKHLVTYLRLEGEYVANHLAYVANPIADIVRMQAEGLVAKYGERKYRRGDTLSAMLIEEARAKLTRPAFNPRPGAPRPGHNRPLPANNPFTTMRSL